MLLIRNLPCKSHKGERRGRTIARAQLLGSSAFPIQVRPSQVRSARSAIPSFLTESKSP